MISVGFTFRWAATAADPRCQLLNELADVTRVQFLCGCAAAAAAAVPISSGTATAARERRSLGLCRGQVLVIG